MNLVICWLGFHKWGSWTHDESKHSRVCLRCGKHQSGEHNHCRYSGYGICGPGGELPYTETHTCRCGHSVTKEGTGVW